MNTIIPDPISQHVDNVTALSESVKSHTKNIRVAAQQHTCQPAQSVNKTQWGREKRVHEKGKWKTDIRTRPDGAGGTLSEKKAPHNFPTHKERDFDKWLF